MESVGAEESRQPGQAAARGEEIGEREMVPRRGRLDVRVVELDALLVDGPIDPGRDWLNRQNCSHM